MDDGNETVRIAVDADEYAGACSIGGPALAPSAIYEFVSWECSVVDRSCDLPNPFLGIEQIDEDLPSDDEIPY